MGAPSGALVQRQSRQRLRVSYQLAIGGGAVHPRLRRVGARERLARPAAGLLRARLRAAGVARPGYARSLRARGPRARALDGPIYTRAGGAMEHGGWRRVAPRGLVRRRRGGAVAARGPGPGGLRDPAQRRTQGGGVEQRRREGPGGWGGGGGGGGGEGDRTVGATRATTAGA